MSVPPYSFFVSLERSPPKEVIDFWWLTIEKLASKDGSIGATLTRAMEQEQPTFVLDLYYFMLDVARLFGDLQQLWLPLAAREARSPASTPEEWDHITTDPALYIDDGDRRAHAKVYAEVASLARSVFAKHGLPQLFKLVHSPMFMRTTESTDVSAVDALGEIATSLALVCWYRDFLLEHPLPNADTIRWIVRELHVNARTRGMRHTLSLQYALYDVVIGNDLDGGEG